MHMEDMDAQLFYSTLVLYKYRYLFIHTAI